MVAAAYMIDEIGKCILFFLTNYWWRSVGSNWTIEWPGKALTPYTNCIGGTHDIARLQGHVLVHESKQLTTGLKKSSGKSFS
jgi:hypothetical protein